MLHLNNYVIFTILLSFVISGCGGSKTFSNSKQIEVFAQEVEYNSEVDVLWVIDNSTSMKKHQELLKEQIDHFMDALIDGGYDFQISVLSTDMTASDQKGKFIGTPHVLDSSIETVKEQIRERILLGENGDDTEKGLEALNTALSDDLLHNENSGFLRDNAFLTVIFISNEDDQSKISSSLVIDRLNELKPPFPDGSQSWTSHFIGILDLNASCSSNVFGYKDPGYKYMEIVQAGQGINQDICSADFTQALTNMRIRIVKILAQFQLKHNPNLNYLIVLVDGKPIPQDSQNGWSYLPETKTIRFNGDSIPPPKSLIQIKYEPNVKGSAATI